VLVLLLLLLLLLRNNSCRPLCVCNGIFVCRSSGKNKGRKKEEKPREKATTATAT